MKATIRGSGLMAALMVLALGGGCDSSMSRLSVASSQVGSAGTMTVYQTVHVHAAVNTVQQTNMAGVQVLTLDSNGNFTTQTGTPIADGGLSFNVPAGTYYVQSGNTYAVTSQHKVDISYNNLGRTGVTYSDVGAAPAAVTAWSVTPWTSNYTDPAFELTVPTVGDNGQISLDTVPAADQTELANATGTYFDSSFGVIPAFDPAAGDVGYLNEFQATSVNAVQGDGTVVSVSATNLVAQGTTGPMSFAADGTGTLSMSTTLHPAPLGSLVIDWARGIYPEVASEFGDGAQVVYTGFSLYPVGYGYIDNSWPGYSGSLFNLYPDDSSITDLNGINIQYGNPYPTTWGVAGSAIAEYWRTVPGSGVAGASIDGGAVPDYSEVTFYIQTDSLASLATDSIGLHLTPPANVRVNGVPTGAATTIPMNQVTLQWDGPSVGTANGYQAVVREVTPDSSNGFVEYRNTIVATFTLPGDTFQLVMPPNLFASGHTYRFDVAAAQMNSTHYDTEPLLARDRLPQATAGVATGLVTMQ